MIGVPVEFTSRVERSIDPVKELRAYGTYHQGFGVWSDDTSLMIALIASLIDGFSLERLSNYFVKCYKEGMFTPEGLGSGHREIRTRNSYRKYHVESCLRG